MKTNCAGLEPGSRPFSGILLSCLSLANTVTLSLGPVEPQGLLDVF
uniref:Uncharacterized protein n=1 Tax=Anguilla anguilla TaxID=7936 RepID=A0A0E9Q0Y6_ANGAN